MTAPARLPDMSADEVITHLDLLPHPEGGFYRETFRDDLLCEGRSTSTAIYYLLREGDISHWHRIDAVEIWHYYGGGTSLLQLSEDGQTITTCTLGPNLTAGELPQIIVPRQAWQSTRCLKDWTLFG